MFKRHGILLTFLLVFVSFSATLLAKETPLTAAVDRAVEAALDEKRIVGCVVLVAHDGRIVYRRAAGLADREKNVPMQENAIFRLASVTKAFTSMVAVSLIDKGKLGLDEPVTKYLPDFRPKLADGTEPIITVRHLLSHTSGLNYSFFEPKDGPYHKAGVSDGLDSSGLTLEENLRRVASCPLLFRPGSKWQYSLSPDILGAVMAKANGTTFQEAMREHVTGPLKMAYAGFSLDQSLDDPARLPTPYYNGTDSNGGGEPMRMKEPQEFSGITYSPKRVFDANEFPSGGGGMAATASDVMLLLEAIRKGEPIGKETVRKMDEDQTDGKGPHPGMGFGLGWSVVLDPEAAKTPQSKGTISWSGAYGHHWFVDRTKNLSVVILTNTAFEGMNGKITTDIRDAVYENISKNKIERFESNGAYSSAVRVNGEYLHLAGIIADTEAGDITVQTKEILDKIETLLEKYGSDKDHVLSATVHLKDIGDFKAFNAAWQEFFGRDHVPARTTVQAQMVRPGLLVEITVTAVVK